MKKKTSREHLAQHHDRVDPRRQVDPERQVPAAEEQRGRDAGDDQHVDVLGEEERREAPAAVLGVVAADELGVGFGQIERRAVRLGESSRSMKTRKPTNCGRMNHTL